MSAFGVITRGQNTEDKANGDPTYGVNKRLARTRKLPAKFKDALPSGVKVSKTIGKRNAVIVDEEDKAQPRKKQKTKTQTPAGDDPGTDTDDIRLNKEPNRSKTRVFSPASEDAQDTRANTEVSSDLDDLGNASTGETNMTDARGWASDEGDWEFEELDDMAANDAKVRNTHHP